MTIIGAMAGAVAPFLHLSAKGDDLRPEMIEATSQFDIQKTERNSKRSALENKLISLRDHKEGSKLDTEVVSLLNDYLIAKDEASAGLKQLNDVRSSNDIFGYPSVNSFLFSLGFPLSLLFCSIILAYAGFIVYRLQYHLGLAILASSFMFSSVSVFYLVWVFFIEEDFSSITHLIAMICASFIVAASILFVFKYRTSYLTKLRNTINLVFEIRDNHYKPVAKKAMYAETYGEPYTRDHKKTKEYINDFEDKVYTELDKVSR